MKPEDAHIRNVSAFGGGERLRRHRGVDRCVVGSSCSREGHPRLAWIAGAEPLAKPEEWLTAKVLPGPLLEGYGDPEVNLAWAVPTKYPGTRYPGVSGVVRG